MKSKLQILVRHALTHAHQAGALSSADFPQAEIESPKVEAHGDFATNIAMVLASRQKMPPRQIAQAILDHIDDTDHLLAKAEIAGPGFINFFINREAWYPILDLVHTQGLRYGASEIGQGHKIQVEFVSANPTGPLHVGHGRGAAVGDTVGNLLAFCGYDVQKEYYINDSGRQIQTLGRSVFLRCKEILGESVSFPDECYQGEYIVDLARELAKKYGKTLLEREENEAIEFCARIAANRILDRIRSDLADFGVTYDQWFSEQSLYDSGMVEQVIDDFKAHQLVYEKDGALWFSTTSYGDEKDRVVVRQNGQTTYFASDIAYHQEKFSRGFERVIDVWGADHHGYIPRMRASIEASGRRKEQFDVILVQLVNLLRGGQPVAMSTRAGKFVTLREVVDEVGRDAARFIFLTRHYESPLDFDLELAKQKTNDNPVYYVQYVHARIASILRKGEQQGVALVEKKTAFLDRLVEHEEIQLIKTLGRYPEIIEQSAAYMEPHRITYYLMDLAAAFHSYYNKHRVLNDDPLLTQARLYLVMAIKRVIQNGLSLLGVSAPEKM